MTQFWAEFKKLGNNIFRFDTRIYLDPIDEIKDSDNCIGAIVGRNPGSAKAGIIGKGMQPIAPDGDKLLPIVRNIVCQAFDMAEIKIPQRGYIQVLNLFYLCGPDLKEAISDLEQNEYARNCLTEQKEFPWIWYVWGGESKSLNPYKARSLKLKSNQHFYLNQRIGKVMSEIPTNSSFAKHAQGLKRDLVIPYLSDILKRTATL